MRPASLLTIARRALEGEVGLETGSAVVVATSGGPDSIALLDVLARLAPDFGLRVVAHGVDHGLRAEAARELDIAEGVATRLGVPFARTRVEVAPGGNVQARARAARHAALAEVARREGARAIATGHQKDDRAETLLLRLLRGAGTAGLAVLPPRAPSPATETVELVRPLLRARRADVLAHLTRHALPFAEDPSNVDVRYTRARVRRELVPLLEALGPGVVDHLEALADELVALRGAGEAPLALPRATQRALASLLASPGKSRAKVWLPGGLVVSRASHDDASAHEGSPNRARGPMLKSTLRKRG